MNIADEILQNQDRDGMLRRSLERIIQLYTDKSHFVYELLQNAEDAGATGIRFVQYSDRLEVMHDGKSFTTENLQGLCDIGQSDKVNDLNQIGEFGVGFKSVFGICETVRLYSSPRKKELAENCHPFAVEIKDFTKPVDILAVDVPAGYTTLFVFPYSVGFQFSGFKNLAALNEAITKRLKNLGVTTLLFMRHLELIEYEIKIPGKEASGEYLLDAEPVNDHRTRVSAIESEDDKTDESLSFRCRLIRWFLPVQLTLRSLSQQTKKEKPLSKKQRIRISPFTSRQRPKANLTSLSKARSALLQTGAVFLPMKRKTRLWLNKRPSSSGRVSLSCAIWGSST